LNFIFGLEGIIWTNNWN